MKDANIPASPNDGVTFSGSSGIRALGVVVMEQVVSSIPRSVGYIVSLKTAGNG